MITKVKSWIRNYFGFSRRETNGTLVLFVIILFLISLPLFYDYIIFRSFEISDGDKNKLDSLISMIQEKKPYADEELIPVELFDFDPNSITKSDFIKLGIQEQVATRIINYRQAGGRFRVKSDLQKIYGFQEADFIRLQNFIDLPDKLEPNKKTEKKNENHAPILTTKASFTERIYFDINTADTVDLKSIRGIGSVLANRIVKYRQSLGGFVNHEQYNDIFGLSAEVIELLQRSTYVDENFEPNRININFGNRSDLMKHPYINRELSQKIIDHRAKNGPYPNLEALEASGIFNDSIFVKLKPYIIF
jgi:competence protein ComEA